MGLIGPAGSFVAMTEDEIIRWAEANLDGVAADTASEGSGAPEAAWGDTFFFYDPLGDPEARKFPFATIVTSNYEGFDESSDLDRDGVFRLNVWVSRETIASLFTAGEVIDPTTLDRVMPHPVYAAQGWVSVLNPGEATGDQALELLRESYDRAVERARKKADRN